MALSTKVGELSQGEVWKSIAQVGGGWTGVQGVFCESGLGARGELDRRMKTYRWSSSGRGSCEVGASKSNENITRTGGLEWGQLH